MVRPLIFAAFVLAAVAAAGSLSAQDKPNENLPRVQMATPFSAAAGATVKVKVRGWKLDQASDVKLALAGATPKILNKGGAMPPQGQDAKQVGDQQVEFEVAVPAEAAAGEVALTIVTPAGESEAYQFVITAKDGDIVEIEPNDGFDKGQMIELNRIVAGNIQSDRDVDVFTFSLEKGKTLKANVIARKYGSAVDGFLTLFDAQGNIISINDDGATADAELKATIPATGLYRLVLQDALDHGGTTHPYRLQVSAE